jgi:hypothetical protein
VIIRGDSPIRVRVLGGEGDDLLDDTAAGDSSLADWQGRNRFVRGRHTTVDEKPYTPQPNTDQQWMPPRDWGWDRRWIPWLAASPDLGLFVGAGIVLERYAFRTHPVGTRHQVRVGLATLPLAFRLDYKGERHRENAGTYATVFALASQLEVLNFYGFGNDTRKDGSGDFFRVEQRQLALAPALEIPLSRRLVLSAGPSLEHVYTEHPSDKFISQSRPYGSEPFGQFGAFAQVRLDTRDREVAPTRGVLLEAGGEFHPALWAVRARFGSMRADASTYLTAAGVPLRPTLALRAAVHQVLGAYPFHEAAFLGGHDSVRAYSSQRFAGDRAAFGNAELRVRLGRYYLVLPGEYGLFALGDAGRVWLAGEDSDAWHGSYGGGLWFAYVNPANTVTIAVARSVEGTGFYVRGGFHF